VPNHAENRIDAPVAHGFDHHVGYRCHVRFFYRHADINTIFAYFNRECLDAIVEAPRRLAGNRVEVPAVPGTAQPAVFDRAFAEGPTLVRTAVVERADFALVMRHQHDLSAE
jgi:hypothetical protein